MATLLRIPHGWLTALGLLVAGSLLGASLACGLTARAPRVDVALLGEQHMSRVRLELIHQALLALHQGPSCQTVVDREEQ